MHSLSVKVTQSSFRLQHQQTIISFDNQLGQDCVILCDVIPPHAFQMQSKVFDW